MFKFTWLFCFYSLTFGHVTTAASSNGRVSILKAEPTTNMAFAMISLIIRGEGSYEWIVENEADFKQLIISIVSSYMKNPEETNYIPEMEDIIIYAVDFAEEKTGCAFVIHYPKYSRNTYFNSVFIVGAIYGLQDYFKKVNFSLEAASFGPVIFPVENAFVSAWNARYWPSHSQSTAANTVEYGTDPTIHSTTTTESNAHTVETTTLLTTTESTVQTTTEPTTPKRPNETTTSLTTNRTKTTIEITSSIPQTIQTRTTTAWTTQNTITASQTKTPTPYLSTQTPNPTIHPTTTTESNAQTTTEPTTPNNTQTIWGSISMVLIASVTAFSLFLIFRALIDRIITFHRELEMIHKATDIQMIRFDLNKHDDPE